MIILVKLILAHLIADFLLQPKSWIEAKENKKVKAWQLYLHAIIHGFLSLLLIGQMNFLPFAILISVIHLMIDILKIYIQRENTKCLIFFLDQALHCLSLVFVWTIYQKTNLDPIDLIGKLDFKMITFLVWLTKPSSIAIKMLITKWTEPNTGENSLQNAGEFIGILERLLIFIFIVSNHWEGVGFLLAAKSIFRFGDLKDQKDRNLTEYILIGTLLSFGLAILSGIVYLKKPN
ncbi:MAG: DUF3307 domain-containing protein [Candidatus Caenarcaniphilales bacterium]|nr:DUF3307 domain-containing protein [Candidatus Caenarcaniphilales bacterium]